MYVCMFGPETMVNIMQILFYIQTNSTSQVLKTSNWPIDMYVCIYVCMYDPGAPKRSVFTRVGRLRVLPPHERAKTVPKRSPGVRFHGGFGRAPFWGFRGPSIHTSIHPSIHPSIHTQFLWGFPETHGFLCMLNRCCMVFTVVFETCKLIWGVKKLLHRNVCMYVWPWLHDKYQGKVPKPPKNISA